MGRKQTYPQQLYLPLEIGDRTQAWEVPPQRQQTPILEALSSLLLHVARARRAHLAAGQEAPDERRCQT